MGILFGLILLLAVIIAGLVWFTSNTAKRVAQGEAMKIVCPALDVELVEGGHMLPMTQADRCVALVRRVAKRQKEVQAA